MTIDLPSDVLAMARRLAHLQGVTLETAVQRAVEQSARAAGVSPDAHPPRRSLEAMTADAAAIAELPVVDTRPVQEIVDEINAT